MHKKITFKHAIIDELEQIHKLEKEAFNLFDRLNESALSELFSDYPEGFFFILYDQEIVGHIILIKEEYSVYLESLAVDSYYACKGIGTIAVKCILKHARELCAHEINLHVRLDNAAAIRLYEKEGFTKQGVVDSFYNDGHNAYYYSRAI